MAAVPSRVSLLREIFFDYITLQNYLPNGDTFPASPQSFISGEHLDLSKWRQFAAGDYGMFW
jgi:hypothetical protein